MAPCISGKTLTGDGRNTRTKATGLLDCNRNLLRSPFLSKAGYTKRIIVQFLLVPKDKTGRL